METVYAYDRHGNKLASFDYEPYVIGKSVSEIMGCVGISTEEATQAISQLNNAITELQYDSSEYDNRINITKNKIDLLENNACCITSTIDVLEERIATLEAEVNELLKYKELLSQLRPALDEKTENPNQNDDLEFSSQIVFTENFLNLKDNNAEGNDTRANGSYSHAEGYYTRANGECSHAWLFLD